MLLPKLKRLLPDLPPPLELPARQARRHLFNCFCDFVIRLARESPALLIFEDLHWADDWTLELLGYFSRRSSKQPLMLVGTYRDLEMNMNLPSEGRSNFSRSRRPLTNACFLSEMRMRRRVECMRATRHQDGSIDTSIPPMIITIAIRTVNSISIMTALVSSRMLEVWMLSAPPTPRRQSRR